LKLSVSTNIPFSGWLRLVKILNLAAGRLCSLAGQKHEYHRACVPTSQLSGSLGE
jgi:hypothetical protein